MKPRNFPTRVLRRRARVKVHLNEPLTPAERAAFEAPKDIRVRKGAAGWRAQGAQA